jgi:hypothetical protein
MVLRGLDLQGLQFLFVPAVTDAAVLSVLAAWAQGLVALWLAAHSISKRFNAH